MDVNWWVAVKWLLWEWQCLDSVGITTELPRLKHPKHVVPELDWHGW
jgi:hypothetical protein